MTDTIQELEERRTGLYQQMQALGDFRPGTISVNFRKCGKRGCACAQPGHAGHVPSTCGTRPAEAKAGRRICAWGRNWRRLSGSWRITRFSSAGAGNWSRSMKRFVACAL